MAAVVAVKPPYGLLFVGPAAYLAARRGVGAAVRAGEYWLAAAAALAYAGVVAWRFPAYIGDVLPAVAAAYLPVRETARDLIVNAAVVGWAALAAALALIAGPRLRSPLVATPALAALGALATFLIDGKGWLYQAYPALALIALAFGAAADRRGMTRDGSPSSPRQASPPRWSVRCAASAFRRRGRGRACRRRRAHRRLRSPHGRSRTRDAPRRTRRRSDRRRALAVLHRPADRARS